MIFASDPRRASVRVNMRGAAPFGLMECGKFSDTSKPASRSNQSEVAGYCREQAGDRYLVNSAGAQKLSRPVSPRAARCTKIKPSCSRRVDDFRSGSFVQSEI